MFLFFFDADLYAIAAMSIKDTFTAQKGSYDNLDSILKSRAITLPTIVCLVKAIVFPVVMYGCEIWTIEKAEYGVIESFELWC